MPADAALEDRVCLFDGNTMTHRIDIATNCGNFYFVLNHGVLIKFAIAKLGFTDATEGEILEALQMKVARSHCYGRVRPRNLPPNNVPWKPAETEAPYKLADFTDALPRNDVTHGMNPRCRMEISSAARRNIRATVDMKSSEEQMPECVWMCRECDDQYIDDGTLRHLLLTLSHWMMLSMSRYRAQLERALLRGFCQMGGKDSDKGEPFGECERNGHGCHYIWGLGLVFVRRAPDLIRTRALRWD
jgi:hypothetical protein